MYIISGFGAGNIDFTLLLLSVITVYIICFLDVNLARVLVAFLRHPDVHNLHICTIIVYYMVYIKPNRPK